MIDSMKTIDMRFSGAVNCDRGVLSLPTVQEEEEIEMEDTGYEITVSTEERGDNARKELPTPATIAVGNFFNIITTFTLVLRRSIQLRR